MLQEMVVHGVPTTAPFHALILENEAFKAGDVDTGFILKHAETLTVSARPACPPAWGSLDLESPALARGGGWQGRLGLAAQGWGLAGCS